MTAPRLSEDSALCTEEASAADVLNQAVGVISKRLHTMDVLICISESGMYALTMEKIQLEMKVAPPRKLLMSVNFGTPSHLFRPLTLLIF